MKLTLSSSIIEGKFTEADIRDECILGLDEEIWPDCVCKESTIKSSTW